MLERTKTGIFDMRKLRWTIISGIPYIDSADEKAIEIGIKFDEKLI